LEGWEPAGGGVCYWFVGRTAKAQAEAAAQVRAATRELHDNGLPVRDVGRILGVPYQRAHQLVS
jgi:hypothetical protein